MGLYENIRSEPVRRLALREPVVVAQNATVRDAVVAMRRQKLGCAIVVDDDRKPLGLFAESQLTQLLSERPSVVDDPLLPHVDWQWPRVHLHDPISFVLAALEFTNIRFLIVVDDRGRLAGLTGQKGLMEYVAEHFPRQVTVQRIGCKPFLAERGRSIIMTNKTIANESAPNKQTEDFQDPLRNYDPKVYNDPLEKALAEETVGAIQSTPVAMVTPETRVHAALQTLANLRVSCLLVEDQGKLVGVFSDRDVLERVALEYDEVKDRPVRELMTANPVVVYESDSAAAALSIMAVSGFRHVPVTKVDGTIVGIISPQRVTEFLRKHFSN